MTVSWRWTWTVVVTGLVLAGLASSAHAASIGPCIPGASSSPACTIWSGKVTFLADGDTMTVRIAGVGERRVRLGGVNATELTRYSKYPDRRRGECHAVAATARVEQLLRGAKWKVRVAAQRVDSRSGKRLRRALSVRRGGRWVDIAGVLAREGHALWLASHEEWAWNQVNASAAAAAAARGVGIWDPQGCGPGPFPGVTPRLDVVWDAPGNDLDNIDGEVLRITNPSGTPLPVAGWWVRDSSARRFKLPPARASRPAASSTSTSAVAPPPPVTCSGGCRCRRFENVSGAPRFEGDGGYLFDPRGNLRAFDQYQDGTRSG